MGSKRKSIKTLCNSCLLPFSMKQSLLGVSSFLESLLTNQQWRFYCSGCPRQLGKVRDSKISHSFNLPSPSHSFSSFSSNSSSTKNGFLGWYLGKLDSHPLITKSITTSLIYAAADLTSQMITLPPSGSIDSTRMLRMAAYGMLILGPSQHFWFDSVSKLLPKRDVLTIWKKLFMGQALYGPSITTVFFSYNSALQGENTGEILARLERDLFPTLVRGLVCWPICDFVTFKFIPVHLQPLMNSSCAYVWTIYLTYMASLEKVGTS